MRFDIRGFLMRSLIRFMLDRLPEKTKLKIAYRLLRSTSGEHRAFVDLFVSPYRQWIPWGSGLGEAMYALFGICRAIKPETVVEIGSARGYSTCAMAFACQQNGRGKVYAIDPHLPNDWVDGKVNQAHASMIDDVSQNYDFLLSRLHDYNLSPSWCEVIRATSSEASRSWAKPIDFLFIDGDHTYEGVKRDFEMFRPWLRKFSLVAFHDSMWDVLRQGAGYIGPEMGVPRFLEELRQEGYPSVTLNIAPGLTILCPLVGGIPFLYASDPSHVTAV